MKIYVNAAATTSRAVMAFCKAERIDAEFVSIDLMTGEHHRPEYSALNPNRLVPALVDGDFVLTEAAAILRYLANTTESPLYPTDHRQRARVDELMSWFEANFYKDFGFQYVYPQLFPHHSRGCEVSNDATLQWGRAKANAWLSVLDNHYLATNPFVAGEQLTIADLLGVSILSLGELVHISLDDYPNVKRWYAAMRDQPSWIEVNGAFDGYAASLADHRFVGLS